MRSSSPAPATRWVALTLAAALGLSACTAGSDTPDPVGTTSSSGVSASTPSASTSSRPATVLESPSASSTVPVPQGSELTPQGTRLSFGSPATVIYEPRPNRGTVLSMTVRQVQRGRLADFAGFILDDAYKRKGAYYYATVSVRNVGRGDVGGVPVPLWGVNAKNTLLPAVSFTTRFPACPSRQLPAKFAPGASMSTCLVYLSPDRGALTAVSYRPTQELEPVTWVGPVRAGTAPRPRGEKPAARRPSARKPSAEKSAGGRKAATRTASPRPRDRTTRGPAATRSPS